MSAELFENETAEAEEPIEGEVSEPKEMSVRQEPRRSITPTELIQRGIDSGLDVQSIQALLAMDRELRAEQAKAAFFSALGHFQENCPSIEKQATADTGKYKYQFAPLTHIVSVIKPHLQANELSYKFDSAFEQVGQIRVMRVTCTLHHVAGHSESSTFSAPLPENMVVNDTQKAAAALTYGKRYALCDILGLTVGQDIDGYVPPEHGAAPRNGSAPTAPTRGDKSEVSKAEATNLYNDWKRYRKQTEQDHDNEAWLAWFQKVTSMPPNICKDRRLWSAADFKKAERALVDEAPPGMF